MDAALNGSFDCVVVGGGLVGATLSVGLGAAGFRVALVEAHPLRAAIQPSYDDRTLALAHASCALLRELELWPDDAAGATPIREVHVSARGRLGTARITAAELSVDALGHVVEGRVLGRAVAERLPAARGVTFFNPAQVSDFTDDGERVSVTIEDGEGQTRQLSTRVLVGADGAASTIRQRLGLTTVTRDYGQTAVIANVTPEQAHEGRAFERFTDTGPIALLPHVGRRCGAVWATTTDHAETLLAQDDDTFLAGLQERAGYRLGRFLRLGKRSAYPLKLVYAPQTVSGRCVVLGNAAHTIHPVAAQGFNLGLRDVAELISALTTARQHDQPAADALVAYQDARETDQRRMVGFTDVLVDAFAVDLPLLRHLPGLAIMAVDRIPGLKQALARRTMGYGSRASSPVRAAAPATTSPAK